MAMTLSGITIDCADPRRLAQFWTAATGFVVQSDFDGDYLVLLPEGQELGQGVYLSLQRAEEPRAGKNRAHPDFHVDDRAATVTRLQDLGASVVGEHSIPGMLSWTVLKDPEGNEFCVAQSDS